MGEKILVVDDEPANLHILRLMLHEQYKLSFARNGEKAVELAVKHLPDLILMDAMMPVMSGYDACKQLKADPVTASIPVVFVSAMDDADSMELGYGAGAHDFIHKPVSKAVVLRKVETALASSRFPLYRQWFEDSLRIIGNIGFIGRAVSPSLYDRLAGCSKVLCDRETWSRRKIELLAAVAPLRDVGQAALPPGLLAAPRSLDESEWELVRTHPREGYALLQRGASYPFEMAAEIALHHHERWDGSGYPAGLREEAIPESARIVAVADSFDAMLSPRPHRPAFEFDRALGDIESSSGHLFDPAVVDRFLSRRDAIRELYGKQEKE